MHFFCKMSVFWISRNGTFKKNEPIIYYSSSCPSKKLGGREFKRVTKVVVIH